MCCLLRRHQAAQAEGLWFTRTGSQEGRLGGHHATQHIMAGEQPHHLYAEAPTDTLCMKCRAAEVLQLMVELKACCRCHPHITRGGWSWLAGHLTKRHACMSVHAAVLPCSACQELG